jgi:glycosyltransferase involved in cell wall biosynthesis
MPNALMEAMAHGRPCIASNVGGVPELIDDGQTGLRFESGDDEALADGIVRLARDPALCRRLGEAARRKVTAEFTVENMVEQHEDLYRSLMNGRRSRNTQAAAV